MADAPGPSLARLLLGGFEAMVDDVVTELARRGHPGVTPVHEFALQAIDGGAATASDLARRLAVSKQAAAKTIAALQRLGYVELQPDAEDGRRKTIRVTPRGREMVEIGAAAFDGVRARWATEVGEAQLEALEATLRRVGGRRTPAGGEHEEHGSVG